ncbi:DNA-binding protein YbaB [Streptosporangium album]|uniref:DNA-binding protein YbaB n=1 Tax=Streptosporangium album TaxID=47479 RepID=A0A7W7RS21_9ACTN|nr:YbaB/EbfC family nucleoid-associated protein [Streptosporangium album]MBB4937149.1 DNA-binding protein YbaB [Streptosporangium album]
MSDEFRMAIDELADEYNRQAAQLRETYGKLNELTVTARSDDGMVTVTVGPRGQVQNIELDPRVYRKLSSSELSRSIMEQIGVATGEVSARTQELMAPFVPDGLPYEELFGEGASFESFLPQSVNLPSRESEGRR